MDQIQKENNLSEDMDFNGFRDIVLTFVHDYTKTKGKEGSVILTNVMWRKYGRWYSSDCCE